MLKATVILAKVVRDTSEYQPNLLYALDWDELMEEAKPEIAEMVRKQKEKAN